MNIDNSNLFIVPVSSVESLIKDTSKEPKAIVRWIKKEMSINRWIDMMPLYIDMTDSRLNINLLDYFVFHLYYELLKGNIGINTSNIGYIHFMNYPTERKIMEDIVATTCKLACARFKEEIDGSVNA